MSTPTGDPRAIAELNELLGRELGRNEYGDPYYSWQWSDDMFWPSFATGKKILKEQKVITPIIGAPSDTHDFEEGYDAACDTWDDDFGGKSGRCVHCDKPEPDLAHNVYSIMQHLEPEYSRTRMVRKTHTWYVCKWLTPWELILGPGRGHAHLKHGEQQTTEKAPSHEALIQAWSNQYPGAEFPAKGWRIPTDAFLPNGPTDPMWGRSPYQHTTPQRQDTDHFIRLVKYQTSRPFDEVVQDMIDQEDAAGKKVELAIGEECRNEFSAFLNPAPGKRGGFISFPWTKADRSR
jgi:hypothetical protein